MTYRLSGPGARASKTEAVINITIVSISNIIFSVIYYNLFFRSLHEKSTGYPICGIISSIRPRDMYEN
jgi:hypothetical protein